MQTHPLRARRDDERGMALASLRRRHDDRRQAFDRFVHLATEIFHVTAAAAVLVDADHQIYFAVTSLCGDETDWACSIVPFTVAENRTVLIPEADADPRWRHDPVATSAPGFQFYAGVPLQSGHGAIGAFCLLADRPCHTFDAVDRRLLESLAFMVADEFATGPSAR